MPTPGVGDEALRYGLLALGMIILGASLLFWRAARYYGDDLVAV